MEAEQVELRWPAFLPEATLSFRMPGFVNLPIEYTVSVYGGATNETVATFVTRETHAIVRALAPGTAYSAVLSARWTRFGAMGPEGGSSSSPEEKKKTMLMAAFVTPHSTKKIVAELSLRGTGDKSSFGGHTTTASFPLDGAGQSAVRLDLDPYFGSVVPSHIPLACVRKPTVPPSPRPSASAREGYQADSYQADGYHADVPARFPPADGEELVNRRSVPEEAPLSGRPHLPTLVPMPPPKFTTRDPVTFAPLIDMTSPPSKLSSPQRPASLSKRLASTR